MKWEEKFGWEEITEYNARKEEKKLVERRSQNITQKRRKKFGWEEITEYNARKEEKNWLGGDHKI